MEVDFLDHHIRAWQENPAFIRRGLFEGLGDAGPEGRLRIPFRQPERVD